MQILRSFTLATSSLVVLMLPIAVHAASFKDVPSTHPAYDAIEYLKSMGIVNGYADGTFQPAKSVNRAEALKLILTPVLPQDGLNIYKKSPFTDVPEGSWFLPYVESARATLGIIAGPPEKTAFNPANPVQKAEFLKMFLLTQRIDVGGSYAELSKPLTPDVGTADWHFPYMRYALASSMVLVDEQGLLYPGKNLTRGDIAQMIYHFTMYQDGRRTQSLLSEAESDIVNIMTMIEKEELVHAQYASARATLAARGALTEDPDKAVVKGAVKTAEGFGLIVESYRAGKEGRLDDAIRLAGEAWTAAGRAQELSPSLSGVATQMQTLAKKLADSAREMKQ